jgi:hypothetical protein
LPGNIGVNAHQKVQWQLIFIDMGKSTDGWVEPVVFRVTINQRDFSRQHRLSFCPKLVVTELREGNALSGPQGHPLTGFYLAVDPVHIEGNIRFCKVFGGR